MASSNDSHLALYGNVKVGRVFCVSCQRHAFVVKGEKQCCGEEVDGEPSRTRRMSEPEGRRHRLTAHQKTVILKSQRYRCLYCDVPLDGYVSYRGDIVKVKVTWDHMAPYSHTLNNRPENFAATCQFCNSWKANLIFKTVDEVRIYVAEKWQRERNHAQGVPRMPNPVSTEETVATLLRFKMPISCMGARQPTLQEVSRRGLAIYYLDQVAEWMRVSNGKALVAVRAITADERNRRLRA